MTEEFDDNQVYRRRILQLEQQIGDLGMEIGVLKKERADLWLDLSDLLASCMVGKPSDLVIKSAADTLTRIKIS